ncbi:hypothetical protein B0A67_13385 [Flavobacterium aquidurense]|uniref:hypothetical protein n=1 Tax=Flavobacterium aquidurense TaxID=362413 RepID=UPI00091F38BE|nr:hypothetical protein [Flavobacterium aquidurense]OXA71246.1 hypothetical protein B0A67_13385 [Flavobacterium aquidurense]SHG69752.1 hypothetical protein SAMN05444481_106227 [Flavobacterium frigidimaris]
MDLIHGNIITTMLTIFGTVIVAILGKQSLADVFDFFQRRKLKNLLNDLETYSVMDKFDDDFKTKFVTPYLKELYFFSLTGIDANEESIPKYIDFKNRLNYTWTKIKKAKQHFDLNSSEIKINLSIYERICANIAIVCFIILLLGGTILFTYLNQFKTQGIRDILIILSSLIIPAVIGILLIRAVGSILIAKQMENRLNKIN